MPKTRVDAIYSRDIALPYSGSFEFFEIIKFQNIVVTQVGPTLSFLGFKKVGFEKVEFISGRVMEWGL